MSRLFDAYRAVHNQGFLPIFVRGDEDSKVLVEGCLEAGMKAIEYTLRRQDAHEMIPWIRKNYPDLYLLVGSTLDDEKIVRKAKRRHPQLMTVAEIDALDVDGFVSMIGWHEESIRKYAPNRLVIPTASTVTEAFFEVGAGAHFAKLSGQDLKLVKTCRQAAAFDYCPIMVTGGVTLDRLGEVMDAGAVLAATGFDVSIKGMENPTVKDVAQAMKAFLDAARKARQTYWPEIAAAQDADDQTWLDALTHHHPF